MLGSEEQQLGARKLTLSHTTLKVDKIYLFHDFTMKKMNIKCFR